MADSPGNGEATWKAIAKQSPLLAVLCGLWLVFVQPHLDRIETQLEKAVTALIVHVEEPELHHTLRSRVDRLERFVEGRR